MLLLTSPRHLNIKSTVVCLEFLNDGQSQTKLLFVKSHFTLVNGSLNSSSSCEFDLQKQ